MDQCGMLGWLDTFVNPFAIHLLFVFVLIVALADPTACGIVPPLRLRCIALLSGLLCGLVVLTAVYVTGIPVRARLMVGIQGRYFLPIVPLLLLFVSNRMIAVRAQPHLLLALVPGVGTGVLVIAMVNALRRYYFPLGAQVWMSPLALSAGLAMGSTVALVVLRRFRPAEDVSVAADPDVAREEIVPVGV
jgi:hypothetical protein